MLKRVFLCRRLLYGWLHIPTLPTCMFAQMLKLVEEDLLAAAGSGALAQWLGGRPLAGRTWASALQHMSRLCRENRPHVLPCLMSAV